MARWVNGMSKKMKAAFVGLTGIDYVYYIDKLPEENNKCKTKEYDRYIGGPAANAAITYALLGGEATLITAIGNSPETDIILKELEEYGVKVINLSHDNKMPGISTICVSKAGNRTIFSGQSVYNNLDLECIDTSEYDFALFDCNQQDISLPLLDGFKCEIVLDAGSYKANIEKYLSKATIVISSENFKDENDNDIFQMDYPNIFHKAITRGEKSIKTLNSEIEVEQIECIDSLAAGDIFHGAFCFAYYEKKLVFEDALKFASQIATESVRYKGPRAALIKD